MVWYTVELMHLRADDLCCLFSPAWVHVHHCNSCERLWWLWMSGSGVQVFSPPWSYSVRTECACQILCIRTAAIGYLLFSFWFENHGKNSPHNFLRVHIDTFFLRACYVLPTTQNQYIRIFSLLSYDLKKTQNIYILEPISVLLFKKK